MLTPRRPPRVLRLALIALFPPALAGCGREPVTAESLAKARRLWERTRIHDYTLEWTSAGRANAYYKVTVRNDEVRSVEQVLPDGRAILLHPGLPKYYGVDGLFLTIADEYAELAKDAPFGQPKGTKAVLLFTPDPTYGYPRSYRRDLVGSPLPLAIDVVRFTPEPARSQARGGPQTPPR
jgi:hypothetical protein